MISIVLPTFNEEEFIAKCLESLEQQDYVGEYEIIVVDCCSTDRTVQLARESGAKVICCRGKGTFHARQEGASATSGEIIIQADADSVYPRDWLTSITKHFLLHPDVVAVGGPFFYYDPPYWAKVEYLFRYCVNKLSLMILKRPGMVSGANFAFRRETFAKIGGYKVDSLSPDQYDISRRLGQLGQVTWDPNLFVMTSARRVKHKSIITVIGDLFTHLTTISMYFARSYTSAIRTFLGKSLAFRRALALFPLGLILAFLLYGYFEPSSQVFGKVYYRGDQSEKLVALTFDDGPNEPYTSEILDILDYYDIKATFFTVGKNVLTYPDTAKRIVTEGHVLGNHSYSHGANHAISNEGCKELPMAQEAILRTVGVKPRFYRPPHGRLSPWELQCVEQAELIAVTWSASSNDQHIKSPELYSRNIVNEVGPGKIVLLHDGYGTMHDCSLSDKSLTVKALPLIIENLRKQGYRFVTVNELLNVPAYNN